MAIRADLMREMSGLCAILMVSMAICQRCIPIPRPRVPIAEPHIAVGWSSMHTPVRLCLFHPLLGYTGARCLMLEAVCQLISLMLQALQQHSEQLMLWAPAQPQSALMS